MEWRIEIPESAAPDGLAWTRAFLGAYALDALAWFRISPGGGRKRGVYGRCWFPTKKQPRYRISCQVPGPFPCSIVTRQPPLYPRADGTFPRAPRGCRRGARCYDPRTGREWIRVRSTTRLRDRDEAVAWLAAHEAFHFLRATRQVPGRNTEIDADHFADEQLMAFRRFRGNARRREPRSP